MVVGGMAPSRMASTQVISSVAPAAQERAARVHGPRAARAGGCPAVCAQEAEPRLGL